MQPSSTVFSPGVIPPPRHPLVRLHDVFAPHSSWRRSVIPESPYVQPSSGFCRDISRAEAAPTSARSAGRDGSDGVDAAGARIAEPKVPGAATEAVLDRTRLPRLASLAPFQPDQPRSSSYVWRIDWATLLKRVYDIDALACPCGGRLKFVGGGHRSRPRRSAPRATITANAERQWCSRDGVLAARSGRGVGFRRD